MRSRFGTSACSAAITVALLGQAPVALAGPPSTPVPAPTIEPPAPAPVSLPSDAAPVVRGKQRATKAEVAFGIAATFLGAGSALLVTGAGIGIAMPIRINQFQRELTRTQDLLVYCGGGGHPQQCKDIELDPLKQRASAAVRNIYKADALDPQVGLSLAVTGFVLLLVGAGVFAGATKARFDEKRIAIVPTWNPRGGGLTLEGRF